MLGLSNWLKKLPDLIFPKICVSCGSEGSNLCFYCNELWLESPKFRKGLLYSFPYANKQIRGLIRNWKYHFEEDAFQKIVSSLKDQQDFLELVFEIERIDFIVPVPLHWQRRNVRGFDQAVLLAEALSGITGIPVLNILRRGKSTKQQARKSRNERSKVDPGLFKVKGEVSGKRVCLVDDVWTTGATMKSAAKALKYAKSGKIIYYTICRGK